ncbi:MAG TPA: hypothetical protein PK095_00700 [Myxococcota bacterium]|nr:hypothetical protein [Myxococcota bacterium]
MSAMTNFLENAIANHVLRNTPYTSPTTVYLGLFTAAPGEAGGGTEVSASGYARQPLTFGAPTDGVVENSGTLTFGPAGASWGTITHTAIFDDSTGGNMLLYGALATPKVVDTGDSLSFAAGALDVSFQ